MTTTDDDAAPSGDQIQAEIRADVSQGLSKLKLTHHNMTIEYVDTNPVFTNGAGLYAVAWTCDATNDEPSDWYQPTGRPVRVEGMSVLWPTDDGWMHRRFIDWNGVVSQLGGSRGRRSVSNLPAKLVTFPDLPEPAGP
jgi:hypothetical protein